MRNYNRYNNKSRVNNNSKNRRFFRKPRRFNPAKNVISIDKLVAKAIDTEPINMFVESCNYSYFDITETLKRNIYRKGYKNPTKIQHQAIPEILKMRDILGLANTGSGKTAAFLIPLINKVIQDNSNKCLILVPTRELAMQIQKEFKSLATDTGIRSVLIIGGNSMRTQANMLRQNPQFLICTPGRLKDFSERNIIDLNSINNVVLDEVDRMLDMGFIDDIKFIINKLRKQRQSMFFSATMNRKSEEIANTLLSNPIKVEVESQGPGKNVDQDIVRVQKGQNKLDVLAELLKNRDLEKVLIFTSTKHGADKLCTSLRKCSVYVEALHGGKRQNQRTKIIENFKTDKIHILAATDVASRGLDVNNISHVINYDMPQSYDDYIHRIGRTGRAGKKGFALTFVT